MIELDFTKRLGSFDLNVSFRADAGVTAVFGTSGSGKTSVVNAVAGLLRPESGMVRVAGRTLFDSAGRIDIPARQRRVGYVFQDARLFPHLTVRRNLTYGGSHDFDRLVAILAIGHLLDRYPRHLSGGEKQRVAIGRAMMSDPAILLLDEPLSGLDTARKNDVLPYLSAVCKVAQIPVLYVSHDMGEVAQLADHIVIMDQGQVKMCGPVAKVLADPAAARWIAGADMGAVVDARIMEHDPDNGLTVTAIGAHQIYVSDIIGQQGDQLRLRIRAGDVMLAKDAPSGFSALNVVPAKVVELAPQPDHNVYVGLDIGGPVILARVTRRSAAALGLAAGQGINAIFKVATLAG